MGFCPDAGQQKRAMKKRHLLCSAFLSIIGFWEVVSEEKGEVLF